MSTITLINPRVRAYGKARLDIVQRVKEPGDWEKLWVRPANPFPFDWGDAWKQCVEYKVDDYPAEIGFFIDILGLEVNALDPAYAMFTSPQREFFLAVVPAQDENQATPPDALRIQFMVTDIESTTQNLEKRGIIFDQPPKAIQPGSSLHISTFHTPHGIPIDLWGTINTDATISEDHHTVSVVDTAPLQVDEHDDQFHQEDRGSNDDEERPIDDEDDDHDETDLYTADQDEEDEDQAFNDDEEDDELLEYDDGDMEDDEDDLYINEEDEYEDGDTSATSIRNIPITRNDAVIPPPSQVRMSTHPAQQAHQVSLQPEYFSFESTDK